MTNENTLALQRAALWRRYRRIQAECRQIKTDLDSYNENQNPGAAIEIDLDFTKDIDAARSIRQASDN